LFGVFVFSCAAQGGNQMIRITKQDIRTRRAHTSHAFTVAVVPTVLNAGVRMSPRWVRIITRSAAPVRGSAEIKRKRNSHVVRLYPITDLPLPELVRKPFALRATICTPDIGTVASI
jgi:hypothetical protein